MEEHPIPQNVTQFEFHLVGDMTLKQFGYLAAGLGLGYVTFMLLATKVPFIAYPLIVIFVLSGVAFAFLPISERPLDHWMKAYVNAIMAPTQMLFQSKALAIDNPYFKDRLALYLDTLPVAEVAKPLPKTSAISQMAPATQNISSPAPSLVPVPEPVTAKPTPSIESKPIFTPAPVRERVSPPPPPVEKKAEPTPTASEPKPVPPPASKPEVKPLESSASIAQPAPIPTPVPVTPPSPAPIVVDQLKIETVAAPLAAPVPSSTLASAPKVEVAPTPAEVQTPPPAPVQQVIQAREISFEPAVRPQAAPPPPPPAPVESVNIQLQPSTPEPAPQPQKSTNLNKVVEYAKEAEIIKSEIMESEKQLQDIKDKAAQPGINPQEFSENFQNVMANLNKLNEQAEEVSKTLAQLTQTSDNKAEVQVKIVDTQKNDDKFLVLTTTPNIINGIVTDSMNNYLEGVIVVTHDKDDLPVRALKSNKLGQFLAATPLQNGTYTLTFEKDNLNFDVLQVTLDGKVLAPIKVTAKPAAIA